MTRALLLVLLVGCASTTSDVMGRVATLGYGKPPTIVVATKGEVPIADAWVDVLTRSGSAAILRSIPAPESDEELCKSAGDADAILTLTATIETENLSNCLKSECHTENPFGEGSSGEAQCSCVKSEYAGTKGTGSMQWRVLIPSSCHRIREGSYTTPIRHAEVPTYNDDGAFWDLLSSLVAQRAADDVPTMFPTDTPLLGITGQMLTVGNTNHTFVEGGTYRVAQDATDPGVPLVAVQADNEKAALMADESVDHVRPGFRIDAKKDVRRSTVYAGVSLGHGTSDEGGYGLVGLSLNGRVSLQNVPVMAEFQLAADNFTRFGTARVGGGVAGGFRLPLGPFYPVGFAELGIGKLYQDANESALTGYAGIGGGLELWLHHVFIFADLRARYYALASWRNDDNAIIDTVTHPDLGGATIAVQFAIGYVY